MNFSNYQNFNDATRNYDFIQKIILAIDNVAPIKERRIKHNSQEWFDGEISEAIKNCDTLLKNLKDLDYKSIRSCIMLLNIRYISWFSVRKNIILKINEMNALVNRKSYGKP